MNSPQTQPRESRSIEGKRFVWILFGMSLVIIAIAIATYFMVVELRMEHGLPVSK